MGKLTVENSVDAEVGAKSWTKFLHGHYVDGFVPTLDGEVVLIHGGPRLYPSAELARQAAEEIRESCREIADREAS